MDDSCSAPNLDRNQRRPVPTVCQPIPIFIGYDPRERAATNVLIDSLYQNSSVPLAITPLVTPQLEAQGLFKRERDPKQSTAFFSAPSDGLPGLGAVHGLRHALPG